MKIPAIQWGWNGCWMNQIDWKIFRFHTQRLMGMNNHFQLTGLSSIHGCIMIKMLYFVCIYCSHKSETATRFKTWLVITTGSMLWEKTMDFESMMYLRVMEKLKISCLLNQLLWRTYLKSLIITLLSNKVSGDNPNENNTEYKISRYVIPQLNYIMHWFLQINKVISDFIIWILCSNFKNFRCKLSQIWKNRDRFSPWLRILHESQ